MRRRLLAAALASCALPVTAGTTAGTSVATLPAARRPVPLGTLMVIGGAEDRDGERVVLRRFVALSRGDRPRLVVLPAASAFQGRVGDRYGRSLEALDTGGIEVIEIATREEADDARLAALVASADGVLLTGGDQGRLIERIGGSAVERALKQALDTDACIAGTSAGAAVMSTLMLRGRSLATGLGLLPGAIIDQHFTERRRLHRLAEAVAEHPGLVGVGVDEDTALVLAGSRRFEVVGAGGVTLVGTGVAGPAGPADGGQQLQRLVPAGPQRLRAEGARQPWTERLRQAA